MALHNMTAMTTATVGTGTITLGAALSGFLSFTAGGVADGETVSYFLSEGTNGEAGHGVYTASGTTLTRSVLSSTSGGAAISLAGNAKVYLATLAQDVVTPSLLNSGTLPANFSSLTISGGVIAGHSVQVPTTGFSITLSQANTCLNPVGTLATGTITMPASPTDGQVYKVTSTKEVSALTMSPNASQSIICPPTFLAPGTPAAMLWDAATSTWYPT